MAGHLRVVPQGGARWPAASRPGRRPQCLPGRRSQADPGTMRRIHRRWLVLSRLRSWSWGPPVQPCLPQDAPLGTRWQLGAWFAGYRHPPGLEWVLVLPVASHGGDQVPAVSLDQLDLSHGPSGAPITPSSAAASCLEEQARPRPARCWQATGSLRQPSGEEASTRCLFKVPREIPDGSLLGRSTSRTSGQNYVKNAGGVGSPRNSRITIGPELTEASIGRSGGLLSLASSQVAKRIIRFAVRRMPPIPAAPPRPVALRRRIRGCAVHPGQPRNGHSGRRTPERSHRGLGS